MQRLLSARAYERAGSALGKWAPFDERQRSALDELHRSSMVQADEFGGWWLAKVAMSQLSFCQFLPSAGQRFLGQCRELPPSALTTYELMVRLEDLSWTWKRMTKKRKQECHKITEDNRELVWYSHTRANKPYLLALLEGERLLNQFAITDIPHSASNKVYQDLLKGKPYQPPPEPLADEMWVDDGMPLAIAAEPLAIADGGEVGDASGSASGEEPKPNDDDDDDAASLPSDSASEDDVLIIKLYVRKCKKRHA